MDSEEMSISSKLWDERRLRVAADAAGVALWTWHVDTDRLTMDDRAFEFWGLPPKSEVAFEELSARVHPPDLDRVRAAFNAMRETQGASEIDFRILHGDELRWISARGRGDEEGMIDRIMYGVFLDVTSRKRAEEERETVSREMHHRIKNLFSLSSAVASIAAKYTDTKEEMLKDLTRRLHGLAAAHNLIQWRSYDQKQAISLEELLKVLLQTYAIDESDNLSVSAPEILVGERSISSLAMIIHELATNSAKYGAFSADAGRLALSCQEDEGQIEIVWKESGGPRPDTSHQKAGFGSEMIDRVIEQVSGSISREWTDESLVVTLRLDKAHLGA